MLKAKYLSLFLLVVLGFYLIPSSMVSAQTEFHLVPCGRSGEKGAPGTEPCQFKHLVILIVRVINYLISAAAIVAMWEILGSAFDLFFSVGNPEKIEKGKTRISNAVVGFGLILLAFVFVNLVVNLVLGKPGTTRKWWEFECIYGSNIIDCPLNVGTKK